VAQQWRSGMAALARLPNVHAKLGRSAMHCIGLGWSVKPDREE